MYKNMYSLYSLCTLIGQHYAERTALFGSRFWLFRDGLLLRIGRTVVFFTLNGIFANVILGVIRLRCCCTFPI